MCIKLLCYTYECKYAPFLSVLCVKFINKLTHDFYDYILLQVAKLKKEISATIKALEGGSNAVSRPRSGSNTGLSHHTTTGTTAGGKRTSTSSITSMASASSARSRRKRSATPSTTNRTSKRVSGTMFSSLAAMFRGNADQSSSPTGMLQRYYMYMIYY